MVRFETIGGQGATVWSLDETGWGAEETREQWHAKWTKGPSPTFASAIASVASIPIEEAESLAEELLKELANRGGDQTKVSPREHVEGAVMLTGSVLMLFVLPIAAIVALAILLI